MTFLHQGQRLEEALKNLSACVCHELHKVYGYLGLATRHHKHIWYGHNALQFYQFAVDYDMSLIDLVNYTLVFCITLKSI